MQGGGNFKKRLATIAKPKSGSKNVIAGIIKSATYPENGRFVAEIASYNEYGTDKIPPRPFLRNTVAQNKAKWRKIAKDYLFKTNFNTELTLNVVGEVMKDDIVNSIRNFDTPPNAKSTIAKKGFDAPLRETGLLLQSIDYELVEK